MDWPILGELLHNIDFTCGLATLSNLGSGKSSVRGCRKMISPAEPLRRPQTAIRSQRAKGHTPKPDN